jgi:YggT family protein
MAYLLTEILRLYVLVIIADVILSYIPEVRQQKWAQVIRKLADFSQKPIREALPQNMPLDPAPMIVIFIINILIYLL